MADLVEEPPPPLDLSPEANAALDGCKPEDIVATSTGAAAGYRYRRVVVPAPEMDEATKAFLASMGVHDPGGQKTIDGAETTLVVHAGGETVELEVPSDWSFERFTVAPSGRWFLAQLTVKGTGHLVEAGVGLAAPRVVYSGLVDGEPRGPTVSSGDYLGDDDTLAVFVGSGDEQDVVLLRREAVDAPFAEVSRRRMRGRFPVGRGDLLAAFDGEIRLARLRGDELVDAGSVGVPAKHGMLRAYPPDTREAVWFKTGPDEGFRLVL